ncbi:hypothetical protein MUA68_14655 (plasmid) [Staphylococcus aureus]|uniref:hypothetical protein n=1 Tax=Staphylococcus aureus TaxID=1280 RepID=UPI0021D0C784|nr:hypothetical protein [Staphylococcus aureus]UXV54411.1 hypothetical protein MUA78_14460 [Staphylococcus aureus]UXV57084.1 hypothetical protein MUA68_14655 [Staphylococcus aureus]
MNLSLIAKLAMAGVVLTGITGTAAIGNISGVNHEAKAEVNPNAEHFKKSVEGHELDFTSTLNKKTLTAKLLADDIKSELEKAGLHPSEYKFIIVVKKSDGSTISGSGVVTNVNSNQSATFDPTKEKLEEFSITKVD